MNVNPRIENARWWIFALFLILHFAFYISAAHAQVIASAVEERSWVIDVSTAARGVTIANKGARVKVGLLPGVLAPQTRIMLTTYASEYFLSKSGRHRVTPLYRIAMDGTLASAASGNIAVFPIEIKYPAEELGKKIVLVWGEDDLWREIPAISDTARDTIKATLPFGSTDFAVFSDDQVLEKGLASWYKYKNCDCAASPDYPKGTKLRVTNLKNGKAVVVRINDFGPDRGIHPDRVIDLDVTAFAKIGSTRSGTVPVKVEKL